MDADKPRQKLVEQVVLAEAELTVLLAAFRIEMAKALARYRIPLPGQE